MTQMTAKTETTTKTTPKKMVSFYADPEVWQALKDWSSKTGSSVGWLARKAITEALVRWKDEEVLLERFRQSLSSQSQPVSPIPSVAASVKVTPYKATVPGRKFQHPGPVETEV